MDLIFNDTNNNFKVFTDVIFLLSAGLILRFSLSLTGQNWVKTYQQTVTFLILPLIKAKCSDSSKRFSKTLIL